MKLNEVENHIISLEERIGALENLVHCLRDIAFPKEKECKDDYKDTLHKSGIYSSKEEFKKDFAAN